MSNKKFMKVDEALEIVLELARGNMIEPEEEDEALAKERERQQTAIDTLEDFAVNVVSEKRVPAKAFKVCLIRSSKADLEIVVFANNKKEAEKMALDRAPHEDFSGRDFESEYQVDHIKKGP